MSDEQPQLSKEEIEALKEIAKIAPELKEIAENDRRAKWLWSSIRVWSVWIAAVITGLSLTWETIVNIIRAAIGK